MKKSTAIACVLVLQIFIAGDGYARGCGDEFKQAEKILSVFLKQPSNTRMEKVKFLREIFSSGGSSSCALAFNEKIKRQLASPPSSHTPKDRRKWAASLYAYFQSISVERHAWQLREKLPFSDVVSALKNVFNRHEFSWSHEHAGLSLDELIEKILRWFSKWLKKLSFVDVAVPSPSLFVLRWIIFAALLALVSATLAYFIIAFSRQFIREIEKKEIVADMPGAPPVTAAGLLKEAEREFNQGAFAQALRYLFHSLLLHLERKDMLVYDRSKTNIEYLKSLEDSVIFTDVNVFSYLFEKIWYGKSECTREDYFFGKKLYDSILMRLSTESV